MKERERETRGEQHMFRIADDEFIGLGLLHCERNRESILEAIRPSGQVLENWDNFFFLLLLLSLGDRTVRQVVLEGYI